MSRKQMWTMVGRWSLVTSLTIALFWVVYLITTGNMPVATVPGVVSYIPLQFERGMHEVSRGWDIFAGLIWSTLIIWGYWKWNIQVIIAKRPAETKLDEMFKLFTWALAFLAFAVAAILGIVWGLVGLILEIILCALIFLSVPTVIKIYNWAMSSEIKPKEKPEETE